MNGTSPNWCRGLLAVAGLLLAAGTAHAQVPSNPYSYTRTSAFTYYGTSDARHGLLASETIEPDNPQSCATTSYAYDARGNKVSATTAQCSGVTGRAAFSSRSSSSAYATTTTTQSITFDGSAVSVSYPPGMFPVTSTNALSQTETKTIDPRFGAVLSLVGPNGLTTTWTLDDFGRKTKELRALLPHQLPQRVVVVVPDSGR